MKQRLTPRLAVPRVGATLSEVLISLLVMSIGVVSLAVLFPISVLRAVQASQLTNAANLRYNVEALVTTIPRLVKVAPSWQPGIAYQVGDFVIPSPLAGLKAPSAVFQCRVAGTSGPFEPNWIYNQSQSTFDPAPGGPLEWRPIFLNNYVVDPLGEVLVDADLLTSKYRGTANGDFFGNEGLGFPWQGSSTTWPGVRAFSGSRFTLSEAQADDLAAASDSWVDQAQSDDVRSFTNSSCTVGSIPSGLSLPSVTGGYTTSRIILTDITGRVSHTRPIYNLSNSGNVYTFDWTPTLGMTIAAPLPTGFSPVRARIETKERRYSWLLSVRRGFSGTIYMDAVIFFRRTFSGQDEHVFPATFTAVTDYGLDGAPGISGVQNANVLGFPGSDDSPRSWVIVQYDSTQEKPYVKKGGFVTDVDNLRWYRIIDVVESDTPANVLLKAKISTSTLNPYPSATYNPEGTVFTNTRSLLLRLESPVLQSGPQADVSNLPQGRAMLMRGIIDVYPIRTQQIWGN